MPKIIISYRRTDSDAIAGRIRDKLASYYGDNSVFMDIDNIPFGIDFRDHIRDALFDNDIIVVVVGPKWVGQGKGGHLRIQEENDPVRIEVETALERGIPVIPVLVNNATMPKPSELPDTLRNFAYRNAAEVDAGRDFHQHMDRLIRSMDKVLAAKGKAPPPQPIMDPIKPPSEPSPPPRSADPPSVPPVTPHIEAPPIAAPFEPETTAKPAPRPDPPVASASEPPKTTPASPTPPYQPPPTQSYPPPAQGYVPPGGTYPQGGPYPTGAPYQPPAKQRLGLIIGLAAGGSAVLAALIVGGAMWFYAPGMHAAPPPPAPTPPPQVVAPPPPPPPTPAPVVQTTGTGGACKSDTAAAFHDDFHTEDPGWGLTDKNETYYVDGQLAIKAEQNTTWAIIYRSLLYKNATVCLEVKAPPSVKAPERPGGGVIFWAADYRNYYVVLVYPDGSYLISRKANGTWATIAPKKKFDGVKPGTGITNQIKITTVGNVASIYINDRKAQDVKGQPPKNGGAVGIFGESEKDGVNEWRYLDIMVVELPATQTAPPSPPEATVKAMLAACKAGSGMTASFADDFKTVDTAWIGVPSDSAYLADGLLKIKAAVNSSWRIAYWGLVFKDITLCAEVKSPTGMKDQADTSGGVIFWATDFDNYYSISIYPDGSYGIDRRVSGSIVKVSPKTMHASVKKGPLAENRVRVTITNNTGTLYINDVKVQDFRGQPPTGGSSVGLFGESETNQRDECGFGGILVAEAPS